MPSQIDHEDAANDGISVTTTPRATGSIGDPVTAP
jgi:hypothetical protein